MLIPQLAHYDDAVKYSVLAISGFFANPVNAPQNGKLLGKTVSAEHLKALQWYARALHIYRRNDFSTFRSDLLAKTVVFVSLEIQQNNIAGGLRLLKLAFTMVAPLLTAGCVDSEFQCTPDSVTETVLPIFMRSAGMLFTPWNELHDPNNHTRTSTELCEDVFWVLCMVWTLWKDFYLFHQADAETAWPKLRIKHSQLESMLMLTKNKLSTFHDHRESGLRQIDVLEDYCSLGLNWLKAIQEVVYAVPKGPWDILSSILSQLTVCKIHACTIYPAASKTVFFHQMATLPLAYMVAVFTNDNEVRSRALTLMNHVSIQRPYTQLHAILLPSQAKVSKSSHISQKNDHWKSLRISQDIDIDEHGNFLPQTDPVAFADKTEMTSATEPTLEKHLEQSVWLTGDMLHVYPERRIVMTEVV